MDFSRPTYLMITFFNVNIDLLRINSSEIHH